LNVRSNAKTASALAVSKFPVGSPASTSGGRERRPPEPPSASVSCHDQVS
jgi:hypothetical protein